MRRPRGLCCTKMDPVPFFYQCLIPDWIMFTNVLLFASAIIAYGLWKKSRQNFSHPYLMVYAIIKLIVSLAIMAVSIGLIIYGAQYRATKSDTPFVASDSSRVYDTTGMYDPARNSIFDPPLFSFGQELQTSNAEGPFTVYKRNVAIIAVFSAVLAFYLMNFYLALQLIIFLCRLERTPFGQQTTTYGVNAPAAYDYNAPAAYNYNTPAGYEYNVPTTYDYNAPPAQDYNTPMTQQDKASVTYSVKPASISGQSIKPASITGQQLPPTTTVVTTTTVQPSSTSGIQLNPGSIPSRPNQTPSSIGYDYNYERDPIRLPPMDVSDIRDTNTPARKDDINIAPSPIRNTAKYEYRQ